MTDKKLIHNFANKWVKKFEDQNINYLEIIDGTMGDECRTLGFDMDCGRAFSNLYGEAVNDYEKLSVIIDEVTDIYLIGSAIFSQWRYFNHWAYSGAEILEPKNRDWFVIALQRMITLSA